MVARSMFVAFVVPPTGRSICTLAVAAGFASCVAPRPTQEAAAPQHTVEADSWSPSPNLAHRVEASASVSRAPGQLEASTQAADQAAAAPSAAKPSAPKGPITGYLSSRYRLRGTENASDQDLYEVAALDYADPARPWLSAHVMGRVTADLDGSSGATSVYDSLSDTYDDSVVSTLYHAYVDLEPEDATVQFRLGRQLDYTTPELAHFDGLSLRTRAFGSSATQAGFYGGVPVHNYASSSDGDAVFGTFAESRPWKGGRARVDWMHYDDESFMGSQADDLIGLGLWHTSPHGWSSEAQYTRLEDEDRDLRLRAQYASDDGRMSARAGVYHLFETQFERVLDFDAFSSSLQEYFPFTQASVSATTALGARAGLDGGVDVRRVHDDGDIGEYNRDWERYYVTANVRDLVVAGLHASVTIDAWHGDGRDVETWGADLTREFDKAWKASCGTYYSLYKYDLYSNTERDDVRTYYTRARWKRSDACSFELTYDFEDDSSDSYQTLRLGAVWRF